MTYEVIIQPEAERAIQRQALWLVEKSNSPSIALRWVGSIRKKVSTLKTNPLKYPIDPDSEAYGEEIRVLLHGRRNSKFRILFLIRGDVVRVVAIRHTAQRSLAEESEDDSFEPTG